MKKSIYFTIFFLIVFVILSDVLAVKKIIPDSAIRMRVVPNSNSLYDQQIKNKVKNELQTSMYLLLKDTKGISEARNVINNNISNIDQQIDTLLKEENYNLGYKLNFSYNYFPAKEYKGVVYEEGYYESVLVTLGEGKGDNWWCVLFPPLCLLEAEESDEVEYKSFIKELIQKYL
jgi:stage II sporulation protein R